MDEKNREGSLKLGPQDWIEMGLTVLSESGLEAVRVEPLAKRLHVTKGSFYWHFPNRDALLDAVLREWQKSKTTAFAQRIEEKSRDASTKLLYLLQLSNWTHIRLERAMRTWAVLDERAATVVNEVDKSRLTYIKTLFLHLSFSEDEAKTRAHLTYFSWLGEFTTQVHADEEEWRNEAERIHTILTRH